MRVSDVMTSSVIVAKPDMTVQAVAKLLADSHISGVPVVDDDGHVVGMVSDSDLLHRTEIDTGGRQHRWWLELVASSRQLASEYVKGHSHRVGDVMSDKVVSVREDTALAEVADLLERHGIRRVPVLRDDQLVGIVSRSNLVRALASIEPGTVASSDQQIRDAVLGELKGQRWALPRRDVIVQGGVVHLWGVVQSAEERRAMCVAAETVPGVKAVKDHMAYPITFPEPNLG